MVLSMKAIGSKIKLREREHFGMLKEIFIQGNSKLTKRVDSESIFI